MKTPVVDYRQFSFKKLNTPDFSHLKLLSGWIVYFVFYFITENLIPYEKCTTVHMFLDDLIPFCEWFIFPYVFWYFLIAASLLYFALYDIQSFKDLSKFIIITQFVAMVIYILLPSKQEMRPEYFTHDNIATFIVGTIYQFDTPTGVCPSLHVAYSLGIASVWMKKDIKWIWKVLVWVVCLIICFSTMFVKQHSAVDFLAAIPVCILAEILVFHTGKRTHAQ